MVNVEDEIIVSAGKKLSYQYKISETVLVDEREQWNGI